MSFIDHLEELRWHVIRSVIAILIGAIIVFIYSDMLSMKIFFAPTRSDFISSRWLCSLGHKIGIGDTLCFPGCKCKIPGKYNDRSVHCLLLPLAFIGGFIIAFPYIFWEFWKFVRPALSPKELKKTRGVIFWVSFLFFTGVAFGYFILTPFMVNFYFNYKLSPQIVNHAYLFPIILKT